MDFSLSEEQTAMVETARRFSHDRLVQGYQQRDRDGEFDFDLFREMGKLGLIGLEIDEKFGGLGTDTVTSGLVAEEISAADFAYGWAITNSSLVGQIIAGHAREELSMAWLPRILAGEVVPAISLTEPRGGSDAANLVTVARRDGDVFVLNGEKTSISFCNSEVSAVFARTGAPDSGARGISAFLVPMNSPGITVTEFDDLGARAVGRGSQFFDNVRVPAANMLGAEGQGFVQVMQGFDFSRALIGLMTIGAARQSLAETWQAVTEHQAFGKPLSNFQGVTFPLAEAETQIEAARWLCLRTLWLKDQGLPHTAEAAMCKWWAPKLATEVIQACLLAHGHSAYSKDLPFQQRMRDVMGMQIGDGTAQIMKLVIARQRAGRKNVP